MPSTLAERTRSLLAGMPLFDRIAIPAVSVGLAAAPSFFTSPYSQSLLVLFVINVMLVLSYRFTTIVGGWSFSHIAIMGLGAYTTAILTQPKFGLNFWMTLPLSVVMCGLFAAVIAFPILRTKGFYFFLSTFAAGEALRQAFQQFPSITGGLSGIAFIPRPPAIGSIIFSEPYNFYVLCILLAAICAVILSLLENSRIGHTLTSVATNEELSLSLGVNTWFFRCFAFIAGSMIAGVGGALFASYNGLINPLDFSSNFMFKIITAAIIGGISSRWGVLLGLIYITAVEEIFRGYDILIPLLYGVSVIAVLLFLKDGLEGLALRVSGRAAGGRNL